VNETVSRKHPNALRTLSKIGEHRTRLPFSAVAEITEPVSTNRLAVHIINISRHGCYSDSIHVFPVGTLVNLSIRHAGLHLETGATVIHSLSGIGMGLNFANLTADMESILQKWIAEVPFSSLETDHGENGQDEVKFVPTSDMDHTASAIDHMALNADSAAPQMHNWGHVYLAILGTLAACLIVWWIARIGLSLTSLRK
jgi:PilZ domain